MHFRPRCGEASWPEDRMTVALQRGAIMKNGGTLPYNTPRINPRLQLVSSHSKKQIDSWKFEFDRLLVSRNLAALSREIEHAAIDLALVAAERVFGAEVSEQLLEESRKLRYSVRDLKRLRSFVAQAESYRAGQKGS
jgi:hypothetical protein